MTDRADMVTPPVELRGEALTSAAGEMVATGSAIAPSTSSNSTAVLQQDSGLAHRVVSPPRAGPASSNASQGASPSEPAYSGQTAVSDVGSSIIPVTPVGSVASKRPPSPDEYFTAAGRPARSASLKKVRYATDCDKDGNPIKTKEEKAAEKEKQRLRKEREKAKKAEEKAARRSASASGSKSSVEPQSASGEASSSRSASASTVPSTSGAARAAETTRSGRQVTAPIDRHRSAAREAKASARKRQLQALQVREEREDEETESEGDEEEDESSREIPSITSEGSRNDKSGGTIDPARKGSGGQADTAPQPSASTSSSATPLRAPPINDDRDEMDLLEMSDEEDAPPVNIASRKKSKDATEALPRAQAGSDKITTPASRTAKASAADTPQNGPASEPSEKQGHAQDGRSAATEISSVQARDQASTSKATPSGQSRSSPMTPSAVPTRPGITSVRAETPEDSARRSFSGKALSSLLSSASHRRPGLGRRSFIPPLHPNRQPAPPPKTAPPMSKKDKDALKKEMLAREENGSDEDEDDEDKPKYNPFEEEIEGY